MGLFNKTLLSKLISRLLAFVLLIVVIFFVLYFSKQEFLPRDVYLASLALLVITFIVIYWFDVVRPLRVIMGPIQALLSGKVYKRIFTTRLDEIGMIANFFNQVTSSINEVSSSIKDRARILEELSVASRLQRDILPLSTPSVNGLQIVAKNKPATELGGDCFDIFSISDRTFIYVGDVTGHGVAAGLIMTMVSSLVKVFADSESSAYGILVKVNKYIKRHVKQSMFMTMVMLSWDQKNQTMSYVGAGHEYIIVYRALTGECEAILSGGVALGMVPDNSKIISEKVVPLNDGDFIVLYSDGITEARNDKNELFGLENLKKLVKEYALQYSADGVNFHIANAVSDYMGNHPQEDDMTLIVIRRDSSFKVDAQNAEQATTWAG